MRRLWWVQAPGLLLIFTVIPSVAALWLSPGAYVDSWRTPKLFDVWTFWRIMLAVVCVLGGVFLGRSRRLPVPGAADEGGATGRGVASVADDDADEEGGRVAQDLQVLYRRAFKVTWLLAVAGNLVMFVIGLGNGFGPSQILVLLSGESDVSYTLKQETFSLIPGVTTTTQFALAAAVFAGLIPRSVSTVVRRQFLVLVAMTAMRSLVVSERLALIEVVVPFAIAVLGRKVREGWRPSRRFAFAPLVALPVLVVFFSAFEFTRSWSSYSDENPSLLGFGATRLEGYYVTALNNTELTWRHRGELYPLPYYTLDFYWQFPGVAAVHDYEDATGVRPGEVYPELLRTEANGEFNNPGGLGVLFADLGLWGGSVACVVLGFGARRLFDGMLAGTTMGVLLYPALFMALVELPRIWYITSGRVFPSLVALLTVAVVGAGVKRRARLAHRLEVERDELRRRAGSRPRLAPGDDARR